jgi:hypothetical protein
MPVKMIEFLLKRIGAKVTDAKAFADDLEDCRAFDSVMEDIDTYFGELKNILIEFLV